MTSLRAGGYNLRKIAIALIDPCRRRGLRYGKDADPDIPIYRQAKAEYAQLQ
jgi:hypothetical protein